MTQNHPETKLYQAPFLAGITYGTPMNEISARLEDVQRGAIDIVPWPSGGRVPEVVFALAYGADSLFLKYDVSEQHIRAVCRNPNEPVYKDSCVEMFLAFEGEDRYYNFEFNLLGTPLVEFGADNQNRTLHPAALVEKIRTETTLRAANDNPMIHWSLTIAMPFELFCYHRIDSFSRRVCSVNFHKCGDELPDPHYLVWNPVRSESPNFHLIDFFGKAEFQGN